MREQERHKFIAYFQPYWPLHLSYDFEIHPLLLLSFDAFLLSVGGYKAIPVNTDV